jgi:drug/metabolite transporter (DMT)-like permease
LTDGAARPAAHRWQALAALVFGACVIGFSGILVRLTATGPAAAGFWRLAFALPLLAVITSRSSGALGRPSRLAMVAGLMFALDLGFWHYGIKYTSVASATVLSNLTPVVVVAFAWIFLKQRPRPLFLVAVGLATAGVWMIAAGKAGGGQLLNAPLGNALSACTAVWYSLYFLAISEGRKTQGAGPLMVWSAIVGAPLVLVAALVLGERIVPLTAAGWAACVGLGFVHAFGQGAIAWGMGRLPASTASVVVLVQPIVAASLGWVLFGEALGPVQAAGPRQPWRGSCSRSGPRDPQPVSVHDAERIDHQHHRARNAEEPQKHGLHVGYLRHLNRGENVTPALQVPCRSGPLGRKGPRRPGALDLGQLRVELGPVVRRADRRP